LYLCTAFKIKPWAFSSAGLEHLPYKQRVGGSNPSTPTRNPVAYGDRIFSLFIDDELSRALAISIYCHLLLTLFKVFY
jgi:hypothetical protein